jgi:hypothetical protein
MRWLLSVCLALASCAEPAQGVEPAPPKANATTKVHPVDPACISRPQPVDAAIGRSGPLQIAVWDDPECETLNVIVTNIGDETLAIWDEPIRWAVDRGRLHAEPVPEVGAGFERHARESMGVCCNLLMTAGAWGELAAGGTFRWTVSTKQLETNDTRLLCHQHAPVWSSHSLEFDAIDVAVTAGRASKLRRDSAMTADMEMFRRAMRVELTLALGRTVTIHPFEVELPLRDPEDE